MSEQLILWYGAGFFSILYGLVLFSFANVAVHRLPFEQSLLTPSRCPRCEHRISPVDNIPVLSWFILRGKCRHCGEPISPRYALIEATGGLLALILFRQIFKDASDLSFPNALAWAHHFFLILIIYVAAVVDIKHRIIPDECSIYAAPVVIAATYALELSGFSGWWPMSAAMSVSGAALWGTLAWFTRSVANFVFGREGLGMGDVKLALLIGAAAGPIGAFLVLMWLSILGALIGIIGKVSGHEAMPLGPSIAVALIAFVLWGDHIVVNFFPQYAFFMGVH